jgi:hypothetical protein
MATESLKQYLAEHRCETFVPRPHYFQDGDHVSYYFAEDRAYEERVDELLTVFRSIATKELVGCKIKGVRRILKELDSFGVVILDAKVTLGLLFVGAALVNPGRRDSYERFGREYGSAPLDPNELRKAAA